MCGDFIVAQRSLCYGGEGSGLAGLEGGPWCHAFLGEWVSSGQRKWAGDSDGVRGILWWQQAGHGKVGQWLRELEEIDIERLGSGQEAARWVLKSQFLIVRPSVCREPPSGKLLHLTLVATVLQGPLVSCVFQMRTQAQRGEVTGPSPTASMAELGLTFRSVGALPAASAQPCVALGGPVSPTPLSPPSVGKVWSGL